MALLFCLPLLLTQALVALISNYLKADRSKDELACTATGKCQMLALTATATDFQLPRVHGPCFGGGFSLQVCREPDCAVMSICPSWITQRLPRGPVPEPQDLSRLR